MPQNTGHHTPPSQYTDIDGVCQITETNRRQGRQFLLKRTWLIPCYGVKHNIKDTNYRNGSIFVSMMRFWLSVAGPNGVRSDVQSSKNIKHNEWFYGTAVWTVYLNKKSTEQLSLIIIKLLILKSKHVNYVSSIMMLYPVSTSLTSVFRAFISLLWVHLFRNDNFIYL